MRSTRQRKNWSRKSMPAIECPDIPDFLRRDKENKMPAAQFVQKFPLTYTILNTYLICPHQMMRRYIKKDLKFVETPEMKFGNEAHAALELRMAGKPLPENMRQSE